MCFTVGQVTTSHRQSAVEVNKFVSKFIKTGSLLEDTSDNKVLLDNLSIIFLKIEQLLCV